MGIKREYNFFNYLGFSIRVVRPRVQGANCRH